MLDLRHTFTDPELPWRLENFGPTAQERLPSDGYLLVDGESGLGRVMFEKMWHYRTREVFAASKTPALVIHRNHQHLDGPVHISLWAVVGEHCWPAAPPALLGMVTCSEVVSHGSVCGCVRWR